MQDNEQAKTRESRDSPDNPRNCSSEDVGEHLSVDVREPEISA
jgi:hypothetical protein